ncbi:MAG: amidohydrolase family protein [Spirochaetaceae bacterium]|jgi:guanine deaminase|nr:amidohydrolase family protein [Spirochaetaceae bacterium]
MGFRDFILKGDLCHSKTPDVLECWENSVLVCDKGKSAGVFPFPPDQYKGFPVHDYTGKLIIPGLVDLHTHAPQFSLRGFGMDRELLDWLEAAVFPEEAKYGDRGYSRLAYAALVEDLKKGATTRACLFATVHSETTLMLMDMLEESGLVCMAGKVSMDRNCPESLREQDGEAAVLDWLDRCGAYRNTAPILTPRFIPSCTGRLLRRLGEIRKQRRLPVQSHLSENRREIRLVKELCPGSATYAEAYKRFGLLGADAPALMAHCVWSSDEELALLAEERVFVAHCPQSNSNLSSGAAPARRFLTAGVPAGLGTDVAGGAHTSLFRAMTDAVQVSKLRQALAFEAERPLSFEEAFYLGTRGGGAFFGAAGCFDPGYELDAVVIDDAPLSPPFTLSLRDRLERAAYLSDDRHITAKYIRGTAVGCFTPCGGFTCFSRR